MTNPFSDIPGILEISSVVISEYEDKPRFFKW